MANGTEYRRDGWRARLGEKKKNGKLHSYVVDLHFPNGQRSRISLGTDAMTTAAKKFARFLREMLPAIRHDFEHQEQTIVVANTPLADILDYYTHTYLVVKGSSQKTRTEAIRILRLFELHCRSKHIGRAHQLSRAAVDSFAKYLTEEGRAAKTVHTALACIRASINAAVDAGLLDQSPIRKWLMPRCEDPEIDPLEPEQLRQVLEIIQGKEPTIYNIVSWIAHTGNRPSDARALTWRQLDLEHRTVERPQIKTGRLAQYQINDGALAAVLREKERGKTGPDNEVFTDPTGGPFHRNYILRSFRRALARAGFRRRVNLKDLRHTFGYLHANYVKTPLPVLQVLMGHKSIEMTMRYVRATNAAEFAQAFAALIADKNH